MGPSTASTMEADVADELRVTFTVGLTRPKTASELVGRVGLDPTTLGLKVNRGTSHRQSPLTESACHLRCCSWC